MITPNSQNQYIVAGQTLTPGGPAVTVSGTRVSLPPAGGTDVIVGTSTEGLGGVIMGGFGGGNGNASGTSTGTGAVKFTGAAEKRCRSHVWVHGLVMGIGWGVGIWL